jgi:hypothetical protein
LYGWASWAKLGEEMRLIGIFLLFKQSVRVVLAVGVAEDVDITELEAGLEPQVPKADWQPVPQ